jgi:hypothetical protein
MIKPHFAMKHLLLAFAAATLVSCASPTSSTTLSTAAAARGAGSSYATAIIVPATNEIGGVRWEYAYIRAHYPGYKFMYQALDSHGGKPYDLLTFKAADGKQHTLYFDISRYFGRY